MDLIKPSVAL